MTSQTLISNHTHSEKLFERAQKVTPGGVNSPVRACRSVGSFPRFIERADAAYLYDVDGNQYIDYIGSWGAQILGHRHPRVMEAIEDALARSTSFGAPTMLEVDLAELVTKIVPSMEMVRLVTSGTEACMSAIRLARAFTGRALVVKFDGCYHGHADSFLSKAGSGLATLGISSSPGVPEELAKLTISLPFNDLAACEAAFKEHKDQIACVIIEPVIGNSGVIPPTEGYLKGLSEICSKGGALLIFDEVMTGFRVSAGGAQQLYGIKPDLTCLGKVIGGGLSVAAYGGRKEIMQRIAPEGNVYQAGTLAGNPLACAAGLAQLQVLQFPGQYARLEEKTRLLAEGITEALRARKEKAQVVWVTGMISLFFSDKPVIDFNSALKCNTERFSGFWRKLLERGVYWPPSQFEAAFVSLEHGKREIEDTIAAVKEALED